MCPISNSICSTVRRDTNSDSFFEVSDGKHEAEARLKEDTAIDWEVRTHPFMLM